MSFVEEKNITKIAALFSEINSQFFLQYIKKY